ncbi:MAG: MobF family relaxase [Xenococcus sp. (in: cyanobacteria)]
MLKATVVSPQQAENYYRQENYYSKEESKKNSEWYGKGAEKLGLQGNIESEDFSNLLHGELPDGERFRKRPPTHAEYKERAGVDLTFSAPKSVSLAVLVNGDKRLEDAHREAVKTTLNIAESRYASTRIREDGERKAISTGNLIVAQFHHDSSREKDPQLHTHAVVINATQSANGKWYSLRNDEIFSNQKLLGTIYQNELAHQAKKLGYEIEQRENGQFELKGYTQGQLEHFSKRRKQITDAVGADASRRERELASLRTRKPKGKEIPREELQKYWQAEAKILGIKHPQAKDLYQKKGDSNPNSGDSNPDTAVNEAINHCSERNVNFKQEEMEKFILSEIGKHGWRDLQKSINQNQNLLKAKDNQYTTLSAVNRELDTIRMVNEGKGTFEKVTKSKAVEEQLKDKELTEGQYNAVLTASTSKDQFIAWQGKAGAGKTYALSEYKQIAEERGYTVKGYAPSASAAQVLGDELGIESNTVARKLTSQPKDEEQAQRQIWIVDEAGLLSAKDTHALLKKAEEEQARVLLVGDTRQLSAVEAGNPFKSLQQAGMETAYLNQSMRQKTQDLKVAVDKISDGQISEGIKILDDNQRIKDSGDNRAESIANDYIKLTPSERKKTLILAGTNADREDILNHIREQLKQEGTLKQHTQGTRLKSKDLTSIQNKYAHHYHQGDVVMPLRNYEHLGLEKGKLYTVSDIEEDQLKLSTNNSSHTVDPAQFHKAVFERKQIEIAEGDRLKWTKNDTQLNRRNGQEFDVIGINSNIATIQYDNGTTESINLNQPQNLDHALVSTTYSSQGKTANRVLVSATSDRTLSKESFYVAASRAKYNLDIYAQDKKQLLEKAKASQAKQNPLEVLENHLDTKSSTHKEIRDKVERNVRSIYDKYVAKQIKDKSLDSQQQQASNDLVTKSKSQSINFAPENEPSPNLQQEETKRRGRRM